MLKYCNVKHRVFSANARLFSGKYVER